jgi:hypothetical protein
MKNYQGKIDTGVFAFMIALPLFRCQFTGVKAVIEAAN